MCRGRVWYGTSSLQTDWNPAWIRGKKPFKGHTVGEKLRCFITSCDFRFHYLKNKIYIYTVFVAFFHTFFGDWTFFKSSTTKWTKKIDFTGNSWYGICLNPYTTYLFVYEFFFFFLKKRYLFKRIYGHVFVNYFRLVALILLESEWNCFNCDGIFWVLIFCITLIYLFLSLLLLR